MAQGAIVVTEYFANVLLISITGRCGLCGADPTGARLCLPCLAVAGMRRMFLCRLGLRNRAIIPFRLQPTGAWTKK